MRKLLWLTVLAAALPTLSLSEEPAPATPQPTCAEATGVLPVDKLRLEKGFGAQHWTVRTGSRDAQSWFDFGLQLSHAFNHQEGVEAFKRAEKADPACAMCVWGEAWSSGPTINFDVEQKVREANLALVDKAAVLAEGGPEKEREMIAALRKRYEGDDKKYAAEVAFAQAMDVLAEKYPDDDEIQVIAADAWLNATRVGDGKKESLRSVALLERVLARSPNDAGAIHFYIHATEFAGEAGKAEAAADRLGALTPNAAHLIHMPSHTYFVIGRYEDAARVNYLAMEADHRALQGLGVGGDVWRKTYHGHNVSFGMAGAMMANDADIGLKLADHYVPLLEHLKPGEDWVQFSAAKGYIVYGRLAAPNVILSMKDPGVAQPMARRLWRYARGEAFARMGDKAALKAEAQAMWDERRTLRRDSDPAIAEITRMVLLGRLAMLDGQPGKAQRFYEKAAKIQEKNFSGWGDPPIWWYPVRRSVAAAYLQAGQWKQAERQATASLAKWPHDPLALLVLAQAEQRLGKASQAEAHMAEARKGWKGRLDGFPIAQV